MQLSRYTRTVMKPRAVANQVNPQSITDASLNSYVAADLAGEAASQIQQIQQKKQTRYETIQRARAVSAFQQEMAQEYARFSSENDLTDPDAPKQFNTTIRQKMSSYLSQHGGGADSKGMLELQLMSLSDRYSLEMIDAVNSAQDQVISSQIEQEGARINREVYINPNSLDIAFKQIDGLLYEKSAALGTELENQYRQKMRGDAVGSVLDQFIDAGDFESADQLTADGILMDYIPPDKQRSYLSKINAGLNAKLEKNQEIDQRREHMRIAQQEGVEFTEESKQSYIFGRDMQLKDAAKDLSNITPDQALAMGDLDLYKAMKSAKDNREGKITQGIAETMKPIYLIQQKMTGLRASVEQFRLGNKAAAISGITAFKQTFEPTSAVMEGEQKAVQAAESLTGMLDNMINVGQQASAELMEQMYQVAAEYERQIILQYKPEIDEQLKRANQAGIPWVDVSMGKEKYNRIFGTTELGDVKTAEDLSTEEILKMLGGLPSQ